MPDELYLRLHYLKTCGKWLNLREPRRFSEKMQWLKLYDRRPEYTTIADKYLVKKYVAEKIGSEHVVPLLGVWDSFEEIDFNALPERFVLKTNNDSGSVVICANKRTFDRDAAKRKLEWGLRHNYYYVVREWPYKNITPRIIAEEYVDGLSNPDSVEYKLTCINGKVAFGTLCTGKAHTFAERKNDFYDPEFHFLPFYTLYNLNSGIPYEKPAQWDEMIRLAEILTADFPTARVDFYVSKNNILFGEITFYTWGGCFRFNSDEWDEKWGDLLRLPERKSPSSNKARNA